MFKFLRNSQKGSVFTVLLAGVAMAGTLSVILYQVISGPMASVVRVSNKTAAKNQLQSISSIIIMDAIGLTDNGGDCDNDGYIEPREWRGPGTVKAPVGGGLIPNDIGAPLTDPWGSEYGYCVWDVGRFNDPHAYNGCVVDAKRLSGSPNPSDPKVGNSSTQMVLAIISAGPDRKFDSSCRDYINPDTALLDVGGDDFIQQYTYNEASAAVDSLWKIRTTDPNIAEIDKNITVGNPTTNDNETATSGIIRALAVITQGMIQVGGPLRLASEASVKDCNENTIGDLRYNVASKRVESCNGVDWQFVVSDSFTYGSIPYANSSNRLTEDNAQLFWDNVNNRMGVGTNTPATKLHVNGNVTADGIYANYLEVADIAINGNIAIPGKENVDYVLGDDADDAVTTGIVLRPITSPSSGRNLFSVQSAEYSNRFVVENGGYIRTTNNLAVNGTGNSYIMGRLGVGTTAPTHPLTVSSDAPNGIKIIGNSSNATSIGIENTIAGGHSWSLFSSGGNVNVAPVGNFGIYDNTASLTRMVIDASGNVGIGTNTPQARLDVEGGLIRVQNSVFGTDQGGQIELGGDNASANQVSGGTPYIDFHYGNDTVEDRNVRIINDADHLLSIYANNMRISGNLGLGNDVPTYKLDVSGTARITGDTYLTSFATAGIVTNTAAGLLQTNAALPVELGGTGVTSAFTAGSVVFSNGTALAQDNANFFWDDTNNRLGIGTATPLSKISIGASGNVNYGLSLSGTSSGIYVTLPSSSGDAINATAPNGRAIYASSSENDGIYTRSTQGNGIYAYSRYGSAVVAEGTDESYGLSATGYTAVSGTSIGATGYGGYFTNTAGGYALVTGAGNVGIGTSTPSYKLQINSGDIFINNGENNTIYHAAHNMYFSGIPASYAHGMYYFRPGWGAAGTTYSGLSIQSADTAGVYTTNVYLTSSGASYFNGGNVGIGNSAPTYKLDVAGGALRVANTGSFIFNGGADILMAFPERGDGGRAFVADLGDSFTINYAGDFAGGVNIGGQSSSAPTHIGNSGQYTYFNSGNVGIGTTTPASKLDVAGDVDINDHILYLRHDAANSNNYGITLGAYNGDANYPSVKIFSDQYIEFSESDADIVHAVYDMNAPTWNFDSGTFYIDGVNNRVGIGNAAPAYTLDVTGTTRLSSDIYVSKLFTTGNNTYSATGSLAADIVIGSNAGGGTRHNSSIMFWSASSASRLYNEGDKFYYSVWSQDAKTGANVVLGATLNSASYFMGDVGIRNSAPAYTLDVTGTARATTALYSPIFYDTNNPAYYIDPASTSYVAYLGRKSHSTGHLVGSYNSVAPNDPYTNPIYTIGSAYNPTDSALSNMYGIGYTHPNAGFLPTGSNGWGLYVAADGDARAFISGSNGDIASVGRAYFTGTSNPNYFAGNVGVGISTPAYPLDVVGTVRAYNGLFTGTLNNGGVTNLTLAGTANAPVISFPSGGSTDWAYITPVTGSDTYDLRLYLADNASDSEAFSIWSHAAGPTYAERFRVTAAGKGYFPGTLAVGSLTAPAYTLDVTGNIRATTAIYAATPGSSWITGKTGTAGFNALNAQTTSAYHPVLRQTTSSGHVINLGGLGDDFGFFGYTAARTANGYDYNMSMDLSNGYIGIGTIAPAHPLHVVGNIYSTGHRIINNASPTIYMQDTDHRSAMIHVNSNQFYILRGDGTNSTGWAQYNGVWPLTINLENNSTTIGGDAIADRFLDRNGGTYYLDPANASISGNLYGKLQLGNTAVDYVPAANNWNYNLVLNSVGTSSIGFHDAANSVSSIRYNNNGFYIGYDDGWGAKNSYFQGGVGIGTESNNDIYDYNIAVYDNCTIREQTAPYVLWGCWTYSTQSTVIDNNQTEAQCVDVTEKISGTTCYRTIESPNYHTESRTATAKVAIDAGVSPVDSSLRHMGLYVTSTNDSAVYGKSSSGYGVRGESVSTYGVYSSGISGVYAQATGTSGARGLYANTSGTSSYGVYAYSSGTSSTGVYASATNTSSYGVRAAGNIYGVYATASGETGVGVYGYASGASGVGIKGYAPSGGNSGYFSGSSVFSIASSNIGGTGGYSVQCTSCDASYPTLGMTFGGAHIGYTLPEVWQYESIGMHAMANLRIYFGASELYRFANTGAAYKSGGGSWAALSDLRLKENIKDIDDNEALDSILKLRGVTFSWKNPEEHSATKNETQYGFIAQEVQKVFPQWIKNDADVMGKDKDIIKEGKSYSIDLPIGFDAYMVEAIKELYQQKQEENKQLHAEIDQLKAEIKEIKESLGKK